MGSDIATIDWGGVDGTPNEIRQLNPKFNDNNFEHNYSDSSVVYTLKITGKNITSL